MPAARTTVMPLADRRPCPHREAHTNKIRVHSVSPLQKADASRAQRWAALRWLCLRSLTQSCQRGCAAGCRPVLGIEWVQCDWIFSQDERTVLWLMSCLERMRRRGRRGRQKGGGGGGVATLSDLRMCRRVAGLMYCCPPHSAGGRSRPTSKLGIMPTEQARRGL